MVNRGSSQPVRAEQQLKVLGVLLPDAPRPLGAYVEAVQSSNLLFLSGMLPVKDGRL
jgi:enamine deaminase RidA (YjgF/YER057c/UK114 family)